MKIATPKSDRFQKKSEPLLPLVGDVELYKLDKTNSVSWELYRTWNCRCKFQCRVLQGDISLRQMIRWCLHMMKIVTGLNVNTVASYRSANP
jgi:hypothetical protein